MPNPFASRTLLVALNVMTIAYCRGLPGGRIRINPPLDLSWEDDPYVRNSHISAWSNSRSSTASIRQFLELSTMKFVSACLFMVVFGVNLILNLEISITHFTIIA